MKYRIITKKEEVYRIQYKHLLWPFWITITKYHGGYKKLEFETLAGARRFIQLAQAGDEWLATPWTVVEEP